MKNNEKIKLGLNSSFVIFFIIAIFYAISNFIWWKLNTPIIPHGVSASHLSYAFSNDFLYFCAPLVIWITKGMFFIFGKEYFDLQIIFINYIFFLISLIFIYKIGVEIQNKITGNISMILFSLTPSIYILGRYYGHQDWHIILAIIINIYCLIKTNHFKSRKWSFLYGVSIGLGALVKDTFLPYFITPFLFSVIYTFYIKLELKKAINITISSIIGLIICGCHYFRYSIILKIFTDNIAQQVPINLKTTRCLTVGLWDELLSPPIFILLVIGFIWFILKYKKQYNKILLLLYFFPPYLAIFLMKHYKSVEYCLGFVPVLILIVSLFLSNINKQILKKILLIVIIVLIVQYIDFSYTNNIKIFYKPIKIYKHNIYYYDIKSVDLEKRYTIIIKKNDIDFLKRNYTSNILGLMDIFGVIVESTLFTAFKLYNINYKYINVFNNIAECDVQTIFSNIYKNEYLLFIEDPFSEETKKKLIEVYVFFGTKIWEYGAEHYKYSEEAIYKIDMILKAIREHYYVLYESGIFFILKKK